MKLWLKLVDKKPETPGVMTFIFQPEEKFDYLAGQFLHYFLQHQNPDERKIDRYFTISSAPSEGHIAITTRINTTSSTFKQALNNMKVGDTILAQGPEGDFTFDNSHQKSVFIAGGIGITPFRAILKDLDFKGLNPEITLLYANKTSEIPFQKLADEIIQKHNNLKIVYVIDQAAPGWTGEIGHIDEDLIKKYVPDLEKPLFYISGPEPMVESVGKMLEGMGIAKDQIKQDFFPGYENI